MRFRIDGREYAGASALEIVGAMGRDGARGACGDGCALLREFLRRALAGLGDRVPARGLDVSDRLDDETLALSYLCLCDEYGVGELTDSAPRPDARRPRGLNTDSGGRHVERERSG